MPPKRRRRFQGLYYHSSPPKVLSMNGGVSNQNLRKRRDVDDFSVKLSTIRIWMHEKDIGKLTRILWAGQGNRLRQQASTNAKVKRFLAAVPYVMNSIKDVHQAVIDNNLETLQANLEPPVPPALITCKDANGLNVIHKAAGLGHAMILEFLIGVWPDGSHETDITGKTPLHWAASCKNNMRCYTLLTQAGCDEEAQDYKMKTPSYYRHKPHEIERAFLVFVPEAPRVSPDIATDWEALSEDTGDGKKLDIKIPDVLTNGFHDRSNDNISEADVIEGEIEMHEDEKPDEDDTDVVEAAASETPDAEAEPEETEQPEVHDDDVEATIEPRVADDENEKKSSDENISNDMNDMPTTTNEEEAVEHQEQDYGNDQEAQAEADVENNDNEEAEALETNDDDAKEDEVELENNELTEAKEEATEETSENADENEEENQTAETNVEEITAKAEESETADVELNNDVEKLDETVSKEETDENTEKENDTAEHDNESADENDNENGGEHEEDLMKSEDLDAEKENNTYNVENEEETVEETNTEDVTTNETDETENEEEEKSHELSKGTEEDNNENQTESRDTEEEANENPSHDENSASIADHEINNNATEEQDDVATENEATNENDEDIIENPDETNGHAEINNNEEVVKENAKNEQRMHSATSLKSLRKLSAENGKKPKTSSAKALNGKHSAGSIRSSKSHVDDDDDNDDDDDDDDQDKIENTAVMETVPPEENENKVLDENTNEEQYEVDSPTSSLAIEGYVQGEPEDNTVQSQSAAYVDEESRIQGIIASGDMEQLAQIVLNGDGNKLLNMQAPEPEIQAFLNNVPNYMNKIRRVHEAARDGNIMALQQALDRRKFAIAKDDISPNGSSPLHVAVLFGHADIVRYLAARFPETTTITDDDGRTALHYAATIKDNGHFYNVLTQLGANPLAVDKLGHTPKFYLESDEAKDIVTYRQLLDTFGAADLEKELLNDQGHVEGNCLETNPIFKTEQGKYLASTLAEPLTKALTEIANIRPEDPVAFLASFLKKYVRNAETNGHLNSSKTNSTAVIESSASPEKVAAAPNAAMGIGSGKIAHAQQNGNLQNGSIQNGNSDEIEEEHAATPDDMSQSKLEDRDEHGQSMLHFSSARSHRRGGLLHMIQESKIDITYRDELYRTARDVSLQANQPANAKEIDHYVLSLAVVGDLAPFEHLALSGYDHIIDVVNDEGEGIIDVALAKGHDELADFLKNIRTLEEQREELHESIRQNNIVHVHELTSGSNAKWLISAKNYYGRTALHIAVLKESEEIVQHFVGICPEALKIGDNLERNALHYAMGTNAVETISRILIQKGAKRTNKDLKGRQPTYYFMNKADILRLQEEEDENR